MPSFSPKDLIELEPLRSLDINSLFSHALLPAHHRFDPTLLSTLTISYPELILEVTTGENYPASQLTFSINSVEPPRHVTDALRSDLNDIVEREEFGVSVGGGGGVIFEMTVLLLLQKVNSHLTHYRQQIAPPEEPLIQTQGAFKNSSISELGVDPTTVQESIKASYLLQHTPAEICAMIRRDFRVLHIESVIRSDLHRQFLLQQKKMLSRLKTLNTQKLRSSIPIGIEARDRDVETMATYLATPKLIFHETPSRFVPWIVKYGFPYPDDINPEAGVKNSIRCGSTYGRGIYSSPSAEFALRYFGTSATPTTPEGFWGLKLIVCATVMGVSSVMYRDDNWRVQTQPYLGSDSHVGFGQDEYIVLNKAQILPCYVVHIDWGKENERIFRGVPKKPKGCVKRIYPKLVDEYQAPGDRQRQREAFFAKASKYLSYGYGAATGTSFVVEDVAEVEEDDENFGEYQKDRIDGGQNNTDIWE